MVIIKFNQNHPVIASIKSLAEERGLSKRTISRRIDELETLCGKGKRYPPKCVERMNGKVTGVDYLAFCDFMANYDDLKEKNLAKDLEPYDPLDRAWRIGLWEKAEEKAI
ncbi:putative DNA-binding transcriptional regulator YafY [Lachnospiraceae bacterium PFB1-21]